LEVERVVVTDGRVMTAGAALAHMDMMLALLARFGAPQLAEATARYMLLEQRPSQTPFMAMRVMAAGDERVAKAEAFVRRNLARRFSMADVAAAAGLAPRSFARRVARVCGVTPVRFVQALRAEAASGLMASTRLNRSEVARRVGYEDASSLWRVMTRRG
jgi:transcriptional regulator GlxA family with amidase domain